MCLHLTPIHRQNRLLLRPRRQRGYLHHQRRRSSRAPSHRPSSHRFWWLLGSIVDKPASPRPPFPHHHHAHRPQPPARLRRRADTGRPVPVQTIEALQVQRVRHTPAAPREPAIDPGPPACWGPSAVGWVAGRRALWDNAMVAMPPGNGSSDPMWLAQPTPRDRAPRIMPAATRHGARHTRSAAPR